MSPKNREIMLGVIACLLLVIYVLALGNIIVSVVKLGAYAPGENVVWVINLLGGIITGVVIANLAVSNPGETPMAQVESMAVEYGKKMMQAIVWIYISVWLLTGLAAFYVGVIMRPDVSVALTELGKSWLGILVGAAYAWFGIRKS